MRKVACIAAWKFVQRNHEPIRKAAICDNATCDTARTSVRDEIDSLLPGWVPFTQIARLRQLNDRKSRPHDLLFLAELLQDHRGRRC